MGSLTSDVLPIRIAAPQMAPRTNLSAGNGVIAVKSIASCSTINQLSSAYPIKLISPKTWQDRRAALVFMLSYGGGLVPGDIADISAHVQPNSRLGILTQGSTKIYKSPSPKDVSRQTLSVVVEDGASVLVIPDPIQPFRNSVYDQYQAFYLHENASLLMLDWVSEGRRTMGETWNFTSFKSKNEVWKVHAPRGSSSIKSSPQLIIRDNVRLNGAERQYTGTLCSRMDSMGVFGTLIIGGRLFHALGQFFLNEFNTQPRVGEKNWSKDIEIVKDESNVLWSATLTRGMVVVKFGAKDVDEARRWLRLMMEREGTIAAEFGPRYLLCLQDR